MRISNIHELRALLKNSHAKIRDNIQLSPSTIQSSSVNELKKPYEDEAFDTPVIIIVHSFRYRGDTDGPIFKWTLDSIVESGLLVDDTTKEVSEIRYKTTIIKKPEEEKTIVTITEGEKEMGISGWYYLHENGELIHKQDFDGVAADIRESDFAKALWPIDTEDRAGAWRIVVESLSIGANKERVFELAEKWGCNDEDAQKYAEYLGVTLDMDGTAHCAKQPGFENLQESVAGFGDSYLEALADLCKNLGFKGGKMWTTTFKDLCK